MIKIIAIAYGVLLVVVFFAQRKMLYHPSVDTEELLVKRGKVRGMEPWRTPTGTLIGWKRMAASAAKGRLLIVHGNGGSALDRANYAENLLKVAPFDVYVLEYPGYGARAGLPSQESIFAAADEALDLLAPTGPVNLIGESLGTGVASYLAGTHPNAIAGVLLVAPYHNMTDVAQTHMPFVPVRLMLRDRFPSATYLQKYHGPVAVLLAGKDEIVPNRFGRKLFDGYTGPKRVWEIPEAGHNDVGFRPIEWWRELHRLLAAESVHEPTALAIAPFVNSSHETHMKIPRLKARQVYLMANGDLRLSANQKCWAEQARMETALIKALANEGWKVIRAHPFDKLKQHGFIDSQKLGMEVFRHLDPEAPLIIAECVWQYSHHLLPGLTTHCGPILTVANWSGAWPGLVGLLNLNGSMTKAGIAYSTLWSEDFKDAWFQNGLRQWLAGEDLSHDTSHVRDLTQIKLPVADEKFGRRVGREIKSHKAIMGVFDEGCMGMFNAIIPDELLHPTGVFKERLSQSSLYAAMQEVTEKEARAVLDWLLKKGMKFHWGQDEATELTERQTLQQCRMYIAAVRIADEFGCATIGIQYQQGLKDLAPASDLVEGLLNNVDRPPVKCAKSGRVLFAGEALPHFNEVDECAGLDGLVTYRLWRELGFAPENTLHDLRWGQHYQGDGVDAYVWVFLISGAAPPAHFIGGYKGTSSERQPPMYFRLGGGTVKGISKPGLIVWSRVFIMNGRLHCDLGVAEVVALPSAETERRWRETTPQWPIMHAVLPGITRDQMMARHNLNHIQVVYAPDEKQAHRACRIKSAALAEMGIEVHLCGMVNLK